MGGRGGCREEDLGCDVMFREKAGDHGIQVATCVLADSSR